jgi:hypothetical protein
MPGGGEDVESAVYEARDGHAHGFRIPRSD